MSGSEHPARDKKKPPAAPMPITDAQREAYHRRHHVWTHREVKQEQVESMVRFGRKCVPPPPPG